MIVVMVVAVVVVIIFVIVTILAIVVLVVVIFHRALLRARCCQPCLCHLCRLCCGHLFIAAAVGIRDYCSDWVIRLDSSHPSFHLVNALCCCCSLLLVVVVLITCFGF